MATSLASSPANLSSADSSAGSGADRELVLTRLIYAPREKIYAAWTKPELLTQWFTPSPWRTIHAEVEVRPGGASWVVMRGPNGAEFSNRGVYLEVAPNVRLVFTDAYTEAWKPSEKPFMTVVLTFEEAQGPDGPATRYTARVMHWTVADRQTHEQMGFYAGWSKATEQLAQVIGAPPPLA